MDIPIFLKKYFYTDYINPNDFIYLNDIFSDLYSNNSIIQKLNTCILDENTLTHTNPSTGYVSKFIKKD